MPNLLGIPVSTLRVVGDLTRGPETIAFSRDAKDMLAFRISAVVFDARLTGYIDSYGLGVIVRVAKECREAGATFAIVGLNDELVTLFGLLKLDTVVRLYTEAEWLASGGELS